MVRVSVPLLVEAPAPHCYTLFSDLSQMPQWSSTLQSVIRDTDDPEYSNWTFSWKGIRLSWRAKDDDPLEEDAQNTTIRWRSVSGLDHVGSVQFFDHCTYEQATNMIITVDYDIASLLAVIMQSTLVSGFVENAISNDLQRFREYALRMYRRKKIDAANAASLPS